MKIGYRKPNIKKSISARTYGRVARTTKSAVPIYGKKGAGLATDPKKAIYNAAYRHTTKSVFSKKVGNTMRVAASEALDLWPVEKGLKPHQKAILVIANLGKILFALICLASVIFLIYLMFFKH